MSHLHYSLNIVDARQFWAEITKCPKLLCLQVGLYLKIIIIGTVFSSSSTIKISIGTLFPYNLEKSKPREDTLRHISYAFYNMH